MKRVLPDMRWQVQTRRLQIAVRGSTPSEARRKDAERPCKSLRDLAEPPAVDLLSCFLSCMSIIENNQRLKRGNEYGD